MDLKRILEHDSCTRAVKVEEFACVLPRSDARNGGRVLDFLPQLGIPAPGIAYHACEEKDPSPYIS